MASSSASHAQLLECSICLDRFTDPRMLPCQHTYCASCLEDLVGTDTSVSCPQCRATHALPKRKVQGLPTNFLLNNLLSLPRETYSPKVQSTAECFDCEVEDTVSTCEHCQQSICVRCLVQHRRLSQKANHMLERITDSLKPSGDHFRTEQLVASLRAVKVEREKMNNTVQELADSLLQALETRQTELDGIFEILVIVHESLLQREDRKHFLDTLSQKAAQSRTTQSLQRLNDLLKEVKTVAGLVSGQQAAVVNFVREPMEAHLEQWGRVEVGETVLIGGENLTRPGTREINGDADFAAGIVVSQSECGVSSLVPHAQASPVQRSFVRVSSELSEPHSSRLVSYLEQSTPSQGNLPPRNIDYGRRGHHVNLSIIGPQLGDGRIRLLGPNSCAYNSYTRELFVCDQVSSILPSYTGNLVLAMDTDGNNRRVFYRIPHAYDVAVSDDGHNVYILTIRPCKIHQIHINGQHVRTVSVDESRSVFYQNRFLVLFSSGCDSIGVFKSKVTFLNTSLEHVRSFQTHIALSPSAMTVDDAGNCYITDNVAGAVHVYTWDGQHTRSFNVKSGSLSSGICVDGNGVVYISRYHQPGNSDRVEVYDNDGNPLEARETLINNAG